MFADLDGTQQRGFSWQVSPDLRIGAICNEQGGLDVALFSDSEWDAAGAVWAPDHSSTRLAC